MIYIQCRDIDGYQMPHHSDCASAAYGAHNSCQDWKLITYEQLESGRYLPRIREHLFVGSTDFMNEVFRQIGIVDMRLPLNSNRPSEIMTLGEAEELSKTKEIFIKPYKVKLDGLSGIILDGANYSCLDKIDRDIKMFVYDVLPSPIVNEWRVYVMGNHSADMCKYSGELETLPNRDYIFNVIKQNKEEGVLPNTYTIDVAVLENGDNVVIEYNDMWAIGNYGVPNDIYLKMLKRRYFDIVSKI